MEPNGTVCLCDGDWAWNATNETLWCTECDGPLPWNGPAQVSITFQVVIYVLYCTIFLVGLCGNGLVCYIVLSSSRMRTVTNYFIVNLAVGDILMTVFCVPFSFVSILLLQYWLFGEEMCRIVSYTQAVSVFVSAYTLVAISMDRYMAILYPFRHRVTHMQAKLIILVVWLVAILTALPVAIVSRLNQPDPWFVHHERYICQEVWESEEQRYYYSMALMGLQYFLPLFVLVFSYTRIAFVVWGKKPPGEAEDNRDQRMARTKRKMVKMMVACVCAYSLAWLPMNLLVILMDVCPAVLRFRYVNVAWFVAHWLAMSHTCYNPLIYILMNSKFRMGFYQALNCCPCVRAPYRYAGVGQASPHSVYTSIHLNTASNATFRSGRKTTAPALDKSTV